VDCSAGPGRSGRFASNILISHQEDTVMRFGVLRTSAGLLFLATQLLAGDVGGAYADQPKGWGGGGDGYELSRDVTEKHGGKASGCMRSTGDGADGFGTLTQWFRADDYRGNRVRI
jgi:hypothetical protein